MTDRLPAPPNDQKEGPLPLGHIGPHGFTRGTESLAARMPPHNNQIDGSLPLGHIGPRGFTRGTESLAARTPPSQ